MQGMHYRLDIKKGVLVTSNDWTIASTQQQSILDFPLFSFLSITFYYISFVRSSCLSFYSASIP